MDSAGNTTSKPLSEKQYEAMTTSPDGLPSNANSSKRWPAVRLGPSEDNGFPQLPAELNCRLNEWLYWIMRADHKKMGFEQVLKDVVSSVESSPGGCTCQLCEKYPREHFVLHNNPDKRLWERQMAYYSSLVASRSRLLAAVRAEAPV